MHAVFVEVNANDSHVAQARESLNRSVVPGVRSAGAKAGHWLAPSGTDRGIALVVFETEDEARDAAQMFKVGEAPPMDDAPEGVTVRTVEVREVIASV